MKKTFLYSLAVLASVTLASCNGDYDDWAKPQHNPEEASAAKYGITFAAGPEAECRHARRRRSDQPRHSQLDRCQCYRLYTERLESEW